MCVWLPAVSEVFHAMPVVLATGLYTLSWPQCHTMYIDCSQIIDTTLNVNIQLFLFLWRLHGSIYCENSSNCILIICPTLDIYIKFYFIKVVYVLKNIKWFGDREMNSLQRAVELNGWVLESMGPWRCVSAIGVWVLVGGEDGFGIGPVELIGLVGHPGKLGLRLRRMLRD